MSGDWWQSARELARSGCGGNDRAWLQPWSPWSVFRQLIRGNNLNRVVIGGCSPRTHETLFQDAVRKAGLNKYLVEIANIRDQDTWVHRGSARMMPPQRPGN